MADNFTFVYDVRAKLIDGIIYLDARNEAGEALDRKIRASKVNSALKAAEWLIHQEFKPRPSVDEITKQITVVAHQAQMTNTATGESELVWVIDSVAVAPLPQERGRDEFSNNLPAWSTWTAQQAADWIDANVTDLASAKVALTQMARAIVALRDYTGIIE